jgi:hypothetical protein
VRTKATGRIGIALASIFGFAFCGLLILYAVSPWLDQKEIPFFGSRFFDTAIFSTFGLASLFCNLQLLRGKSWAWWSALVVSALILSVALVLLVATLHPKDDFARSEGGFGLFISICLLVPGASTIVLLTLPSVRQRFRREV